MFHHYSVRPFVTLCRRALYGCLLLLLTVPAAMGDTQLPAAAYPQRRRPDAARTSDGGQSLAILRHQLPTGDRAGQRRQQLPFNHHVGQRLLPGRTDGRPRARYHRQGTVRSAADQVSRYAQYRAAVPKPDAEQGLQHHHRAKVDYLNKPGEIGFSSIDIGRMLLWLKIIKERYPEFANDVDNVVLR